jgi:Protein of unknown function (DUF1566)
MMSNTSSNPSKDTNMIVRNTYLKNGFRVIVGTLLIGLHLCIFLGAGFAQAATKCVFFDKFKDNNDGTVTDPRNGLMWKRCAEGFTWSGSACEGVYLKLNWEAAMEAARQSRFLDKTDWRIPSKAEFSTVTGRFLDCRLHNDHPEKGEYAVSHMLAYPVNEPGYEASLPGVFWTSTKPPWKGMAYYDSFYLGLIDVSPLENEHGVRFVRSTR